MSTAKIVIKLVEICVYMFFVICKYYVWYGLGTDVHDNTIQIYIYA